MESPVRSQAEVWESPEFEEIGVGAEVTMYVAQLAD
ncbi:MAG TPA: pyrroloquinoline quinone precursor peptide PqqA [Amycolatopsis sp.]|jgi:coenzyme PQQ precursor peptide PqqA|nr:pyrroloquinoline quinone precursor peptide PqqA [Amycolatopsis sp.]